VDEVNEPDPGPGDVLLRVTACGSCGSDLSYIAMGGLGAPGGEPMCLGHEISGTVDWIGSEVRSVRVGDRAVVHPGNDQLGRIGNGAPQGGLTSTLLVTAADAGRLFAVPDGLALEVAALAEPLGVGMHAVDQLDVAPDAGVCVMGCGPIGLAAVATLVDRGHRHVVAVDLSATRRDLAVGLGAVTALDPQTDDVWTALSDIHGTKPFMFGPTPATAGFVEASGAPSVIGDVIARCGVGSRLSVVALHYAPVATDYLTVLMKEITIRGSIEYPPRFEDAIDLLARRDLSGLITHRFGIGAFEQALGVLSGSKDCGKVLVTFEGDCSAEG
jgi:threonine dehydrogenase-like Zn-dependent dehydrogenase